MSRAFPGLLRELLARVYLMSPSSNSKGAALLNESRKMGGTKVDPGFFFGRLRSGVNHTPV